MSIVERLPPHIKHALVRALDDIKPAWDGARISHGWNPNAGYGVPAALDGEAIPNRYAVDGVELWASGILSPVGAMVAKELRDGQKAEG